MIKLLIYKTEYRFCKNDLLHSIHDMPSYYNIDGWIYWRKNGILHRLNGPAIIGPSIIDSNNIREWWQNGKRIKVE